MMSLTAFAHFTRIYALCNEGCVFGGIVLIKEAIDSYYVRMVLTYDGIDNLLAYKDDHQEVEYGYEGMWKLTRRKDARGVVCFLHDREERLLEIINEKGEHYAFAMDAAGNVLQEEGFDGGVRKYVRDRAGRVIKETLPSGKFKEYEYDRCGRVTRVTHDYDKAEEQTYGYYASGRLAEARNEHAIVSFRYDNMGLPVEERSNEHVIKRTYDKSGQIATLTSSLGADLTYERNEFGELTCFSAGQAEAPGRFESRHEYDSLGFELERMLPGGVTQSFAYDDIGRLIDSKTRQSSKVRRERKYHWGKADRLLKTEDNRFGTTTYEYSPTGHLQKAVYADGREEYRLSDKVGNLFDDPDRKLRKYLRGGKLEQSGEWRFVYDRDGQLVEKYKGSGKWWDSKSERWRYIWNQNGTLKEVRPPGGGDFAFDALFTYDALGRRLSKDAIGITCWLWNGNVPLHEWTSSQSRNENGEIEEYQKDLRTWLFEEESFVPLALFQDGKAYSIVTDHLGTPVEAYNEQGEEVWYRRLDMNGKVIEERSMLYTSYKDYIKIPFLFQGQYYDEEIKLAYNRFRYYAPELGRYISEDPIRFNSREYNLYSYVFDTNTIIDSYGLDWNYVLIDANKNIYYHGRASDNQTMQDVARRHSNTHGTDGARFGEGDTLQRKTMVGTDYDTVRGVEQRGISENTLIGKGNNKVRGNKINGISETKQKTRKGKQRLNKADEILKGRKVSELPTLDELKFKNSCI